jgi:hypothetical protein
MSPDNWVLVKITGTHPHYRVFCTWRGGYLSGDAWRMNSGVVGVTEDQEHYYFQGHSGSLYTCHKHTYGWLGSYGNSVLCDYVDKSNGMMEVVEEMPDVMNIDWGKK